MSKFNHLKIYRSYEIRSCEMKSEVYLKSFEISQLLNEFPIENVGLKWIGYGDEIIGHFQKNYEILETIRNLILKTVCQYL